MHEEESHRSGALMSEAPLANGFKMQLLDSLSFNNHLKDATVSLTEEHEVKANNVDDVDDVAVLSIAENKITKAEESFSCISPDPSLSFYETVEAFEYKEPLTDIQPSAADCDGDKVVPDVCSCTEGLAAEPSFASSLISCNPIVADLGENQLSPRRKIQPINATREIRESEIELMNEVSSDSNSSTDDAKDGLKFSTDLTSSCSSDHSFKISSNLETSGIQSSLSSFEDTFVHLSTCSENGTTVHTSDEDSGFQFDIHLPSFHAKSSAESSSHG